MLMLSWGEDDDDHRRYDEEEEEDCDDCVIVLLDWSQCKSAFFSFIRISQAWLKFQSFN